MTKRGDRFLAVFLVATLLVSTLALAGVGSVTAEPSDDLSYGEDGADPIWIDVDTLTVARHPMDEGASHSDMAGYINDSGDFVSDPVFVVNTSIGENTDDDEEGNRNPYVYNPAHIDDEDFGAFPRRGSAEDDDDTDDPASEDNLASALDASEWTTVTNSGNVSVSDTTLAQGVDAVDIDVTKNGNNTDVTAEVSYSNWTDELDSDEEKRVLQIAGDVTTLDTNAVMQINVTDESGDYKQVVIDPDKSGQDADISTVTASTGTFVYQVQLSQLTTNGGGSFDNIESLDVTSRHGDVDVTFSWIDLESKGKDVLGENVVDDDDDDSDYDNTNTHYNATGTINVSSMDTLGSEFNDATINDVDFPAKFRAQDLKDEGDDEDYQIEWSTSTKYTQPNVLELHYKLELPDAIDLSYSGTDLMMTQAWPESRYVTLEYEEDAGTDNFTEIEDDDTWTDVSSNLGSEDDDINLDSSISSNTVYAIHVISTFQDAEKGTIDLAGDEAAGGGAGGQESEGFIGSTLSWILGIVGAGAALLFRVPQMIWGATLGRFTG